MKIRKEFFDWLEQNKYCVFSLTFWPFEYNPLDKDSISIFEFDDIFPLSENILTISYKSVLAFLIYVDNRIIFFCDNIFGSPFLYKEECYKRKKHWISV